MGGDGVAIGILVALTALFLSLVPAFLLGALGKGGTRFQPLPVWPLNLLIPLLAAFALWTGVAQGRWFTLGFLGLATGVLALQYLAPKRWVDGRVHGVWYTPLAVKAVDRTGGNTVLVLALGYKLAVPPLAVNQDLIHRLAPTEDVEHRSDASETTDERKTQP